MSVVEYLLNATCSDLKKGISDSDLEERREAFGDNEKEEVPPKGYFALLWEALNDFTLKILIASATISIILETAANADHRETAWIEGFAIFIAVLVCSNVTAFNDYRKVIIEFFFTLFSKFTYNYFKGKTI